jgi:methyltransferase (TIGR00027 family)
MTRNAPAGVGLTALAMAQERRIESRRSDRLFVDPLAEAFVLAAAGAGADSGVPGLGGDFGVGDLVPEMRGFVSQRTRLFDDQVAAATRDGVRQIAILAAGLDARAYRLDLAGSTVFELDTEDLMAFKAPVVEAAGVRPAGRRVAIGIDLREDFGPALREAGLDREQPTLWLVEGLFPYLRIEDIDLLMGRIGRLCGPGSRVVADEMTTGIDAMIGGRGEVAALVRVGAGWLSRIDDAVGWFSGHGWKAEVADMTAYAAGLGREVAPMFDDRQGPAAVWAATAVLG